MAFKFAYFVDLTKGYQPEKFNVVDCLGQVLQRDYKNTIMTSLRRHFIFLGFEISVFYETEYKLSTCQV